MYNKDVLDEFVLVFSRNIMNLVHISRLTWQALSLFKILLVSSMFIERLIYTEKNIARKIFNV